MQVSTLRASTVECQELLYSAGLANLRDFQSLQNFLFAIIKDNLKD
jgi:hypothetical protein